MSDEISTEASGVLDPLLVSVKEAARLLGVHPWTVYRMLDDKECPLEESRLRGRRLVVYRSLVALATPVAPAEESA